MADSDIAEGPARGAALSAASRSSLIGAGLLALLFVGTTVGLHAADFYHRGFFDHGVVVPLYELARLVLLVFLPWLVYAVGAGATVLLFGRRTLWSLKRSDRYLLGFLVGAGVWHWGMFPLGLAGLYVWPVAIGLAAGTMILSVPHLAICLREATQRPADRITGGEWLLIAVLVLVAVAFVLTRGLYPLGGHDYYDHYFPYLIQVIHDGNLGPNAVWYHFYYQKGLSLTFLAMLLSDPIAPAMVTTGFALVGAGLVWRMLRSAIDQRALPLVGAILFIVFFVIGNDDLEKPHDIVAILMLGIVWLTTRVYAGEAGAVEDRRPWILALHLAAATVALILIEVSFVAGFYLAGLFVWFLIRRDRRNALSALQVCLMLGVVILGIFALNYVYTGLPLDQGMLYWWRFADLHKIVSLQIVYEALALHASFTGLLAVGQPWSFGLLGTFAEYLRLSLWWPLLAAAAPFLLIRLFFPDYRRFLFARLRQPPLAPLLWFAATVLIVALVAGRLQVDSFLRLSSFDYGTTLCTLLLLLHYSVASLGAEAWGWTWARIAVVVAIIGWLAPGTLADLKRPELTSAGLADIFGNAARLWSGSFSLKEAYQNQQGWAYKLPWGGIYPGLEVPWKIAGSFVPVYSFHIHSYCMLPDCSVEEIYTFRFGERWQTPFVVLFGTAEEAVQALKVDGRNYFFFSKELKVFSPLSVGKLFSPKEISKYLAIRWTDGTSYLLTWPGPDTTPIDDAFLAAYTKANEDPRVWPLSADRKTYDYLLSHQNDLHPFAPPWCVTCAGMPTIGD